MRHVRFSLLLELEQRGVEEALSEIETERLAGVGVTGRCLPVQLVVTIARVPGPWEAAAKARELKLV